jgi:subtilisin family serine protease
MLAAFRATLLRLGLITTVLLTLSAAPAPEPVLSPNALGKIAPWVLEHTAHGQLAEFQVVLAQQADLSAADQLPTKLDKGRYVYETLYTLAQTTQKPVIELLQARGAEYRAYYLVNLIWVKGNQALALELAARPDIARIDANPTLRLDLPASDPPASAVPLAPEAIEPGLTYVGAPTVWGMGYMGQGIVVGGQDTGYRWTHATLKNKYRGWNGTTADHNYNWHDSIHSGGGTCGADSPQPCDDYGHGTHTMGTMVGDDGATNQIGMAPNAKWIGCRNMDVGNGTPTTYLECFEFFLAPYPIGGTPAQGNPAFAPDVTNNSWGCPTSEGCNSGNWATMQAAVAAQRAAGIMTVASAGNNGPACSTVNDPPGMFDEAYSVGAFSSGTGAIASFSSRGPVTADGSNRPKPDISAPGVSVRSATNSSDTAYGSNSGTSMAGPHVAGAVALLWSARPELVGQITQTEQILNDSAIHVSVTNTCSSNGWPNNVYGYGRLNILNAITMTAASIYQVTLAPLIITQSADPGQTVTYTARLTNTGTLTDSYTLQTAGGPFGGNVSPTTISDLAPSNSRMVTLTVTIPANAYGGTASANTLSATSQTTTTAQASVMFTTTANVIAALNLTPNSQQHSGNWNALVIHTLTLTNTGNVTDTFSTGISGATFTTTAPATIGPLTPNASATFTVTVQIPLFAVTNDTATLTATSQTNGSASATAILQTTVTAWRIWFAWITTAP